MLSAHLGTDTFLLGVSNYLKAHKYANATTNDLWSALSSASGQDITAFMDPWIRKIGFPVVTLAEEPGQIGARQSRFLVTGDVKPTEDETIWWIPLGLKTKAKSADTTADALTSKQDTIRNVDESFYKINSNQTGFYRTNYPPKRLTKLGEARQVLNTEDRIGLVGDAAALAQSGNGTTAAFLALVELFKDEQQYLWVDSLGCMLIFILLTYGKCVAADSFCTWQYQIHFCRCERRLRWVEEIYSAVGDASNGKNWLGICAK
jgi:aminopeptidase N